MPELNALIPMGIKPADWGNALSQGVQTGNALLDAPARRRLLEAQAKEAEAIAANGGMTPYQSRSLDLQQQALNRREIPSGFQATTDGGLAPIPGGPADPAYRRASTQRQNVPPGYQYKDANNPDLGLEPIPGGPASKLSPQAAGTLAMLKTGHDSIDRPVREPSAPGESVPTARQILSDPAKWNTGQQFQSMAPGAASFLGYSDVVNAQAAVKTTVEAALRIMTGAAAPEQEVERYAAMFTPSWKDNKDTASSKLQRLDEFVSQAQGLATQGRMDNPAASGATSQYTQQDVKAWVQQVLNMGYSEDQVRAALKEMGIDLSR